MNKYMIERMIDGIGSFTAEQYKAAAQKSNAALAELGDDIEWIESHVAADQTFCVYMASGEEIIMEHSRITGFPANRITEIVGAIGPWTADD